MANAVGPETPRNPCADLAKLTALLNAGPQLVELSTFNADEVVWLERVRRLAVKYLRIADSFELDRQLTNLLEQANESIAQRARLLISRALVAMEEECGSSAAPTGTVIGVGEAFKVFTEVTGVLKSASRSLFIIDPYMNDEILSHFAITTKEEVALRLLTEQKAKHTDSLRAAVDAWRTQYGAQRPLEARIDPTNSLHDRVIFVDDAAVWVSSQSFKDLAVRATATLVPLDDSLLEPKRRAYDAIWKTSTAF
jgi:hypothetical protein